MANFRIVVETKELQVDEVVDEDTRQPLPEEPPPPQSTEVAVIHVVLDTSFNGCWWVHQVTVDQWWEWTKVCPFQPKILIRVNDKGKIKRVAFKFSGSNGWEDLAISNNRPAQPSVRLSISIRTDTIQAAPCRYVVIGGRAYKIC